MATKRLECGCLMTRDKLHKDGEVFHVFICLEHVILMAPHLAELERIFNLLPPGQIPKLEYKLEQ